MIIEFAPPETALTTPTFTAITDFTCLKGGADFTIEYFASIDVSEVWNFTYSPEDPIENWDRQRTTTEQHIKLASGKCVAPEGDPAPTPMSALPTSTPDPLEKASEVFLADPTETPSADENAGSSSASVQLSNGMTVQAEISPWGGNATLKKSWSGSVDFLQYTLNLTVSGETKDGNMQDVEYQISAIEPRGLIDWTDVIQNVAGTGVGDLNENVTLPWAGDYVVKGSVGGEAFEITVAAIEPELRYGILAEPSTWKGQTPLSDEGAIELADFSGEWMGWVDQSWIDEILAVSSADVMQNESKLNLERVERFVEPIMTGVQQSTPDGGRTPYEMIVPRALYEGTFSYKLPAFSYETGHCGDDILTYEISGTVNYAPNKGLWSAPLVLTGTLSGPLPKLTREFHRTVQIEVISGDNINRQRLFDEGGSLPIIGPLEEGAVVGFVVQFSDLEENTGTTLDNESTCESYPRSIALAATNRG